MVLIVVVVAIGLAFDFTNGFHDTANYVATWVGTRALSPRSAVLVSAGANLAGAFVTTAVAKTVAEGDHQHESRDRADDSRRALRCDRLEPLDLAARAAVELDARADRRARRSRARPVGHAGVSGRALAQGDRPGRGLAGDRLRGRVRAARPDLSALPRLKPGVANRGFRTGQLFSGTWVAFTHGANDAQKTMGVIALALYEHGSISSFYIPTWVKVAAGLTIAAGTYVGGWRIIRTLGQRVYKMRPSMGSPPRSRPARRSTSGRVSASRSRQLMSSRAR